MGVQVEPEYAILAAEATTNQACCAVFVSTKMDIKFTFYLFMAMKDYLVFQKTLYASETLELSSLALGAGDFITIKSSKANVSFNFVGQEIA